MSYQPQVIEFNDFDPFIKTIIELIKNGITFKAYQYQNLGVFQIILTGGY